MATVIWAGLVLGSVYVLVAQGITLSLIPTSVINFAQGGLVVGGSYLTYEWLQVFGLPLAACIAINVVAGAVAGVLCEVITVRPLLWRRGENAGTRSIVTTVGFSIAIVGFLEVKWGSNPLLVPFKGSSEFFRLLGTPVQPVEIVVVCSALVLTIGLEIMFRVTQFGQVCLAVAEDREAAMLRGVNVNLISILAFAAAGAVGAVIGVFTGPITYAEASLGVTLALGGFVAIALGGEGSFAGAGIGGWLAGLVSTIFVRFFGGNYDQVGVLALLVVTLVFLPKGLGGAGQIRRKV